MAVKFFYFWRSEAAVCAEISYKRSNIFQKWPFLAIPARQLGQQEFTRSVATAALLCTGPWATSKLLGKSPGAALSSSSSISILWKAATQTRAFGAEGGLLVDVIVPTRCSVVFQVIASSSAVLLFLILLASFSPAVVVSFNRRRGLILPIQVIYLSAFPFAACSEGSYMSSNKTSNKNCNFFLSVWVRFLKG